jgi:hypothetical protein
MPTYENIMVTSKPEFVNMAFLGHTPQLKLQQPNEGKTILQRGRHFKMQKINSPKIKRASTATLKTTGTATSETGE